MPEEKPLISLRKNSSGDVIFEINTENITLRAVLKTCIKGFLTVLLKLFLPLFSFFDYLASKKKLVISGVGLGIGLGLSVLISVRPDTLQAFPTLATAQGDVMATFVTIKSIDLQVPVEPGSVQDVFANAGLSTLIHDERSAELGSSGVVVIADASVKNIFENLDSVAIGDIIEVTGTNNGRYTFVVTEIRDMQAEFLPNVIGAQSEAVILYKTKDVLRTQVYMVIAKPQR